ncbi:MAG: DUF4166 domain-containing protein [Hyphomonadaceae bacterium]
MTRFLVVGGAGVFGSRLVEGLRGIAGAEVMVAGRRAGAGVRLDRTQPDAALLRGVAADVVIDAAGPFQGGDLGFARAVIEAGAHYIDLADARDFVAAFPSLDALARARGVAAIAGASSTPALTHAVIDALCAGWRRIDGIRAGIAPGGSAPRGASLVRAILDWTGAPVRVFADGAWREWRGWSHVETRRIEGLGRRRFALAETPDLDLLVAAYAPKEEALFMAALESPLMQRGLETLSALRAAGLVQNWTWAAHALRRLGDALGAFDGDRGGMIVEVLGRDANDAPACARWRLIAPAGRGPYTPTLPALALARRIARGEALAPGARACVGMLSLREFETDFQRLGFVTTTEAAPLRSPFEGALGAGFEHLPKSVRRAHQSGPVIRLEGHARVCGASNPLTSLAAWLFGFPRAAERVPVSVTKRSAAGAETWVRAFPGRRMKSVLRYAGPARVEEQFGPLRFVMAVGASAEGLSMEVIGWRLWGLPLPRRLAPRSLAWERPAAASDSYSFDVPIAAPLLGRLTHYSGELRLAHLEAAQSSAEKMAP